jgi:alpha-beta hydrolase superfamily lysophospholipase
MKISFFASMATLGAVMAVPEWLSHSARRLVGSPPTGLNATSVEIRTSTGGRMYGWMSPGKPDHGVVLLLHGVWGDRREMVDRAKFLSKRGHGVLLVDLPGHGESSGDRITYGAHEAEGVSAALAFLARNQPGERIGVIGVSLGAASLVLAKPRPAPSAVVLESMFPTIEDAVFNRSKVWLGAPSPVFARLLIEQVAARLRISPAQLHPIEHMGALGSATLIVSGSIDRHTTVDETQRIFEATSAPKDLWIVEGAAHVDLHAFARTAYEARIGAFLDKYLRTLDRACVLADCQGED